MNELAKEVSGFVAGLSQKDRYRFLSRLKSDCESSCRLWGVTKEAHAAYMVALWEALEVKPVWLTKRQLDNLVSNLK